ncbi:MAG: NTP transferase domain-containing protein [Nitrososphaerota archaeon]|nr:NTP transferase domain-containing protein [Nitrososphaerota archaeon]
MVQKFLAIVMAGGLGSRMRELGEKPLVKIGGKEILSLVVQALRNSKYIEQIIVACSPYTPSTVTEARKFGMTVVIAPGAGYIEDMRYVIKRVNTGHSGAVIVNSDLPFLTGDLINSAIEDFLRVKKHALAVMVPAWRMRKLGFEPSLVLNDLSPAGLNILDTKALVEKSDNDWLEQETMIVTNKVFQLVNVNTPDDVRRAEWLLARGTIRETDTGGPNT